jgi:cytochrome subunit of sulfide dehydrogenase
VRFSSLALAALAALGSTLAIAQGSDPNLARNLAATCANCHGTDGRSTGGMASLAGVASVDIVRKMQDFKAGKTPATIMHQLSKGYSDEQITLIAGWFAAQKPAQ